ncbi:auxin-responsive protein SAUR50-like [Neltuma alba]|uniref:auxin-responsive protein SAUR50-like n=1 Tax=Neltuma alba TaxID=207710 RepID=UPI0010A40B9A|nr:auxin-responsive protein SAUR50-like [Prosopis alba]
MAKYKNNNNIIKDSKKKGGGVKLKIIIEKLQKSLLLGKRWSSSYDVPEDVKEGHFAVIAEDGEGPKRFVVPLRCLTHPTFLRLLEQAAEEYGFDQEGAISIPCRPSELESILSEPWLKEGEEAYENSGVSWKSGTLVKPCFEAPAYDTNMKKRFCQSS